MSEPVTLVTPAMPSAPEYDTVPNGNMGDDQGAKPKPINKILYDTRVVGLNYEKQLPTTEQVSTPMTGTGESALGRRLNLDIQTPVPFPELSQPTVDTTQGLTQQSAGNVPCAATPPVASVATAAASSPGFASHPHRLHPNAGTRDMQQTPNTVSTALTTPTAATTPVHLTTAAAHPSTATAHASTATAHATSTPAHAIPANIPGDPTTWSSISTAVEYANNTGSMGSTAQLASKPASFASFGSPAGSQMKAPSATLVENLSIEQALQYITSVAGHTTQPTNAGSSQTAGGSPVRIQDIDPNVPGGTNVSSTTSLAALHTTTTASGTTGHDLNQVGVRRAVVTATGVRVLHNPCINARNPYHVCSRYCSIKFGTPVEFIRAPVVAAPSIGDIFSGITFGQPDEDKLMQKWQRNNPLIMTAPEHPDVQAARRDDALTEQTDADIGCSDIVDTFAAYKPTKVLVGQLHPDAIVETSSLASIKPPKAEYKLGLHKEVISRGLLSSLQLETLVYASQRHTQILQNGQRGGFLLGDGAGVGKGRQIAGLCFENFVRGRHKAIWFSASSDLHYDARRDFADIGAGNIQILSLRDMSYANLECRIKQGVIFCTYSCLISGKQDEDGTFTRMQQLVNWCGADEFDGMLVFDECHKAKNLSYSEKYGTKAAKAVVEIQRMLPNARVVYVTATGGSELVHIGYMERLGLWGLGTAFPSRREFMEQVSSRGVGAMEMVAMDMKARGIFMSRTLSFQGAEFDVFDHELEPETARAYDEAVTFWIDLKEALDEMCDILIPPPNPNAAKSSAGRKSAQTAREEATSSASGVQVEDIAVGPRRLSDEDRKKLKFVSSIYWSSHQRFFRQLVLSAKVPAVVKMTREALEEGYCVVIGMQSTGEARVSDKIAHNGFDGDFISSAKEIALHLVRSYFFDGSEFMDKAEPVAELHKMKTDLLRRAKELTLAINPLDALIDELGGPNKVAEMTGRSARIVRRGKVLKYEARVGGVSAKVDDKGSAGLIKASLEAVNISERRRFQAGEKLVGILSDAASTGISLQADRRAPNQRRRVHITLELPWSADKAVQQLGRSHRSNQSSAPLYRLLIANVGGEWRTASAVASRLQSMGALTQGDRRANVAGSSLADFNVDTKYGLMALKETLANIYALARGFTRRGQAMQIVPDFIDESYSLKQFAGEAMLALVRCGLINPRKGKQQTTVNVKTFLNRIFGINIQLQGRIFRYFHDVMEAVVADAKKSNTFSEGIVDCSGESIKIAAKEVIHNGKHGGETFHVEVDVDRGISWETALDRFTEAKKDNKQARFYRSKREKRNLGAHEYLLAIGRRTGERSNGNAKYFTTCTPNAGYFPTDRSAADLRDTYHVVTDIDEVERNWKRVYSMYKTRCFHVVKTIREKREAERTRAKHQRDAKRNAAQRIRDRARRARRRGRVASESQTSDGEGADSDASQHSEDDSEGEDSEGLSELDGIDDLMEEKSSAAAPTSATDKESGATKDEINDTGSDASSTSISCDCVVMSSAACDSHEVNDQEAIIDGQSMQCVEHACSSDGDAVSCSNTAGEVDTRTKQQKEEDAIKCTVIPKDGSACSLGCRIKKHHIITGAVLDVWAALSEEFKRDSGTGDEYQMKVVRMVTDDGERIVGLRVPHELLPGVLEAIQSEHKRMYQIFNQEPAEGTTEMAESHFEPTMRVAGEGRESKSQKKKSADEIEATAEVDEQLVKPKSAFALAEKPPDAPVPECFEAAARLKGLQVKLVSDENLVKSGMWESVAADEHCCQFTLKTVDNFEFKDKIEHKRKRKISEETVDKLRKRRAKALENSAKSAQAKYIVSNVMAAALHKLHPDKYPAPAPMSDADTSAGGNGGKISTATARGIARAVGQSKGKGDSLEVDWELWDALCDDDDDGDSSEDEGKDKEFAEEMSIFEAEEAAMSAPKELDVILSKSSKGYHVRWKDGTEATMKRVEMTSWEGEVLKFETELSERKRMTKKRQERLDAKKKLAEIAEARAAEERTRTATHVAVEDYEPFDDQGITLKKGDLMQKLDTNGTFWFVREAKTGKEGWVESDYLDKVVKKADPAEKKKTTTPVKTTATDKKNAKASPTAGGTTTGDKTSAMKINACDMCALECAPKSCSRCHTVGYCSRECQVAHWKAHKVDCKKAVARQQQAEFVKAQMRKEESKRLAQEQQDRENAERKRKAKSVFAQERKARLPCGCHPTNCLCVNPSAPKRAKVGHPGVSVPRVPDRAAGNAATPTSPSQPAVAIDAGSAVKTELVTTAVHGDVKESSTPSKQVELNATSEAAAVKTVKTEEMSDDEADEKSTDAHAVVDMDSDDDADDFDEGEDVDWGGIDLDAIEAMVAAEAAKPAC